MLKKIITLILIINGIIIYAQEHSSDDSTRISEKETQLISSKKTAVNVTYGQKSTKENINTIANIEVKKLQTPSTNNLTESLQGQLSGLNISTGSGMPNPDVQHQIRGLRSFHADEAPLWIIDGINMRHIKTVSDLELVVSIHDISSIKVLKDAGSTAMYGSRGANGVILITTK